MANAAAGCFIICSTPDRYDMAMVMAGVTSMHTSSCAQDFFIFVGAKDSASGASMCKDRRGDGQASSYDTQYALLGIYLLCILLITNRSTKQIGANEAKSRDDGWIHTHSWVLLGLSVLASEDDGCDMDVLRTTH